MVVEAVGAFRKGVVAIRLVVDRRVFNRVPPDGCERLRPRVSMPEDMGQACRLPNIPVFVVALVALTPELAHRNIRELSELQILHRKHAMRLIRERHAVFMCIAGYFGGVVLREKIGAYAPVVPKETLGLVPCLDASPGKARQPFHGIVPAFGAKLPVKAGCPVLKLVLHSVKDYRVQSAL